MNTLDLAGCILSIVEFFVEKNKLLTQIMSLMVFYKAWITLRVFKKMRYLITLIIQCLKDMVPFLSLVFIALYYFAVVNFSDPYGEQRNTEYFHTNSFPDHLLNQYLQMYGDNPGPSSTG